MKLENAIYAYERAAIEHRAQGNRQLAERAERSASQFRMAQFMGRVH